MGFRRGNKSNKVPNVKLRPAQPAAKRPPRDPAHSLDSGFDSDQIPTQSFVDVCPRPLNAVVLCATGISDKTSLFKQAIELGAQPLSDLTDKVTHLLALEPGSAKYKCALENRIPIMHPDWITESYQVWLRGDDVNLDESVRAHRLPIFSGVVLCVSGIDDVARRTQINRLVSAQGGAYVKNIERPVRVTHLLCAHGIDAPSEKMLYAAKFNARKEADIHIVWEQWFWDCLRLQGRCDDERYDVARPPPEPVPELESESAPDASARAPAGPADSSLGLGASGSGEGGEDEEPARALKRVPAVTLQIWQSILQPRGFAMREGRLVRSPSQSQAPPASLHQEQDSPGKGKARAGLSQRAEDTADGATERSSVLRGLSKSASFAPQTKDASTPRPPFARSSLVFGAPPSGTILAQGGEDLPAASSSRVTPSGADAGNGEAEAGGIFQGKTFRAMGEARSGAVRQAVEEAGGRMVREDEDEEVDFVIVRLVSGSKLYLEDPDPAERIKYRTECWLERCLFEERICSPDEHVSFTPIPVPIPLDGAEHISLSFSGLDGGEAWGVRRLALALGMPLAPAFSRLTTHLLCPARVGPKFDKAQEWGVPVVDMAWLEGVVRTGCVPRVERQAQQKRNEKGKERAVSADVAMADITNAPPEAAEGPPLPPPRRQSSPLGDDDYADAPFGQPSGLLGDSVAMPELEPHLIPGPADTDASTDASSRASSRQPSESRSLADLRADMMHTRIASSQGSPSPLKMPTPHRSPAKRGAKDYGVVDGEGRTGEPRTPSRISRAASDELQARLNSLLGKRAMEEEEEAQEDGKGGGDDVLPAAKRRARALSWTKPKNAHPSFEHYFERSNSATSIVLDDAPLSTPREADLGLDDPVPRQPLPSGATRRAQVNRTGSGGAGVMYHDPAQHRHRERLMSLLGPGERAQEDEWAVLLQDAPADTPAGGAAASGRNGRATPRAAEGAQEPKPKKRPRRSGARRK